MFKTLMRGVLCLTMIAMSVCSFSQGNSPRWIQSPTGDTLLGFNSEQVDKLGEKLILKSYLVQRNYELVQLNDLMTQRCNALASALDERKEEVANLDHQITLCQQRIQSLDAEILRLQKIIEKEKRRKIFWKAVAGVEAVVVVVVTTVTLIK